MENRELVRGGELTAGNYQPSDNCYALEESPFLATKLICTKMNVPQTLRRVLGADRLAMLDSVSILASPLLRRSPKRPGIDFSFKSDYMMLTIERDHELRVA